MAKIHREGVTLLSESEGAIGDRRDLKYPAHTPPLNHNRVLTASSIIFVHGLRGHPRGTWSHRRSTSTTGRNEDTDTHTEKHKNIKTFFGLKKSTKETDGKRQTSTTSPSDIFWPEEYLVPDLPQARIWTYGYNADVIGGLFQANNQNSVSQHGRDFAVRSETICKRTKLVVFLGTPHRGSTYAGWGEIASNLASLALQDSNKQLVQTLKVNDEVLDNIHEEFKTILTKCAIKVHSFQEAKGISGMKGLDSKVVDNFSSKLDLAREQETVETIDANHMEMARCSSRDEACYRQMYGVLKQFIRTGLPSRETNSADNNDRSSLAKQFIVPFSQDEHFIGREDILGQLDLGDQQEAPKKHRRHALVGLGGVGKSQIAIEYAYRARKHQPQLSVFWIHASTRTRFEQAYQEMAERLELPGRHNPEANVLRLVYNWLSDEANGQWHMILDNVDNGSMFFGNNGVTTGVSPHDQAADSQPPLESFLPQSRNGSILITSRTSTAANNLVDTFGKLVSVEPMKEKDSVDLLKTKIPVNKCSETDLVELTQALEGIPLAITHAAAYIRSRPRVTVSIYLSLFQESESNQASLLNNNETKDLRRDHSIRHAVITTWQISFDQIQLTWPDSAKLLSLMAMFDRQGIPESILYNGRDRLQFEDAVAPLTSFSLIKVQSTKHPEPQVGEHLFEMHDLVQLATRKWLEIQRKIGRWHKASLRIMAADFPSGEHETWAACRALLPHARKVLGYTTEDAEATLDRARIEDNTVWYLLQVGEYAAAEKIGRTAIVGREEILGVEHLDTLTSVSNLGSVLESQGKYEEAEAMHQRALKVRQKVLGEEHPNTLTSVGNVGVVLERQGKYKEAEALQQRALEGREKVLGVEHPDTLTSVSNLGLALSRQGKYKQAEAMYLRALESREKGLGVEHPHTLTSVSNLGSVLERQGKYKEAEGMYKRALQGRKKVLGEEHPHMFTSVSNLGTVLERQGKYEEAEAMHQGALEGREKVLGVEHPHTLTSVSQLGLVLSRQGKYNEAEAMHLRALQGREKVLRVDHPQTLTSVSQLGSVLNSLGRFEEAGAMHWRALEGREKVLGLEHPQTLTSVSQLGSVLSRQGKYNEAEAMYRRALEGREKVLGVEHPHTLTSFGNLGSVLESQGKYSEAEAKN
ncbi:hypothetical protein V492_00124 [Pseudogymnoascus sp. VKM F-4246]|nr:hypothetical protein V492_00124 [Pseudogymnoascus sp. VKM F-4246]